MIFRWVITALGIGLNWTLHAEMTTLERYEDSKEEESLMIESLAQKFIILQENNQHEGRKVRGTHAKGTCVDGQLTVHPQSLAEYRVGLFAAPGEFPVRVRFANAASKIQPDFMPDARAVSLSVDLGSGRRQDFAMNNGPIFPIGSLRDFNFLLEIGLVKGQAIAEALRAGATPANAEKAGERASYLHLAKNPARVPGFLRTVKLGADLQNKEVDSYRNQTYWSGSAFSYGKGRAAKFVLSPCRAHLNELPNRTDPDFLQNDLKEAVNSERTPVCFDFQVQLLDANRMQKKGIFANQKLEPWEWVEDVTLDWDAAGATAKTVARLTINSYSVYDDEVCDDPANAVDVMKNSLPEHRGLGRINRARARSESASKNNR